MLRSKNISGLVRCEQLGSQLKCVSGYWEQTLRSGYTLAGGGAEYIHRREEIWLFNDDLLSPLGLGPVYEIRSYSRRPTTDLMMMQVWEIGLGTMEKEVKLSS